VPRACKLDAGAEDSNFTTEKLVGSRKRYSYSKECVSNDWRICSSLFLAIKGSNSRFLESDELNPRLSFQVNI
jgi:hypothetical protein